MSLKATLKPYDPALMEAYAVSRVVNSVKNDTEECIELAVMSASPTKPDITERPVCVLH